MSKYKIGQKVRIKKEMDFDICNFYGGFVKEMEEFFGEVVTLSYINGKFFMFEEGGKWAWDLRAMETLPQKVYTGNEANRVIQTSDSYGILPAEYFIDKIVENDGCVITFFRGSNECFKTVAKCQVEDTYNLVKGVEICVYKALRRISQKNLQRLCKGE